MTLTILNFLSSIFAALGAEVFDSSKAGTMSMQALLMGAITILAGVVIYLHKDQKKTQLANHEENRRVQSEWMAKMETERAAISRERLERINMLLGLVRDDTEAKVKLKSAIDNMTDTVAHFEALLTRLIGAKGGT